MKRLCFSVCAASVVIGVVSFVFDIDPAWAFTCCWDNNPSKIAPNQGDFATNFVFRWEQNPCSGTGTNPIIVYWEAELDESTNVDEATYVPTQFNTSGPGNISIAVSGQLKHANDDAYLVTHGYAGGCCAGQCVAVKNIDISQ